MSQIQRTIGIFVLGNVLHLILGQLYFEFYDWLVMWNAAGFLSSGGDLYASDFPSVLSESGRQLGRPSQMPLFIYFLGLTAWYGNQRFARLMMWIVFFVMSLFLVQIIASNSYRDIILLCYFFNPFLIIMSYYGLFDHFPVLFSLFAIDSVNKKKSVQSGVWVALGTLTKLYPIYIGFALGLYLIKSKKLVSTIKYLISSLLPISVTMLLLYNNFGEIFIHTIIDNHTERLGYTMSIWTLFNTETNLRLGIQLVLLVAFPILVLYLTEIDIWNFLYIVMIWFIAISNVVQPHYFIWYQSLFFPIMLCNRSRSDLRYYLITTGILLTVSIIWGEFRSYIIYSDFNISQLSGLVQVIIGIYSIYYVLIAEL